MAEKEKNPQEETLTDLLATEIEILNREQLTALLQKITKAVSEVTGPDDPQYENATHANEMIDAIRAKLAQPEN